MSTDGWEGYDLLVPSERQAKWWHVADSQIEELVRGHDADDAADVAVAVPEDLPKDLPKLSELSELSEIEAEKPWKVSDEALERLSLG